MYTGELDLSKQSGENIFELLIVTDELLLEELLKHVQDYLIENRSTWVQQNLVPVLCIVHKLVNCEKLQDYCFELICKDPQKFIASETFSLDRDVLFDLFKLESFRTEE